MKKVFPYYLVWSSLSLILVVAYIVVNFCFEKPKTYGYEYFNGIVVTKKDSDGVEYLDEKPIFEVNYVKADTMNDLYLTEVVLTTYTDYNHTAYKRFGIQVVGKNFKYWSPAGNEFGRNVKYQNSYLSTSTANTVNYSNNLKGVYFYEQDIDGVVSRVREFDTFERDLNVLNLVAGEDAFVLEVGGANANYKYSVDYWKGPFNHVKEDRYTEYCSLDLFWELATRFFTNYDDGSYSFKNLNLDKYFTIYKQNNKKQFYTLSDVSKNNAYFSIKTNYKSITTGLKAEDSILGIVAGDVKYNQNISNESKNYYSVTTNLKLTEQDFVSVVNENMTGVIGLSNKFNSYLQSLNNLTIDIEINANAEIIGLDVSTLANLNINSITINSTEITDFYIIGNNKKISKSNINTTLNLLKENGGIYE